MCGLTAIIGSDIMLQEMGAFQKIAYLSIMRGRDSTGVMDFNTYYNPRVKITKDVCTAGWYFGEGGSWSKSYLKTRYLSKKGDKVMPPSSIVAHARAATQGKVNRGNSHPFLHKHIVGVHNGTIGPDFKYRKDFETDSEAIFYHMAMEGEEETLEMLEGLYSGAYALIWYNLENKTMNMARNSERPLWMQQPRFADDVLYLSSDDAFLKAIIPYYYNRHVVQPSMLSTQTWVSFDMTAEKNMVTDKKERRYQKQRFFRGGITSGRGENETLVESYGFNPHGGGHNSRSQSAIPFTPDTAKTQKVTPTTGQTTSKTGGNEKSLVKQVLVNVPYLANVEFPDPNNNRHVVYKVAPLRAVSEGKFQEMRMAGCACCNKIPYAHDPVYVFQDYMTILCEDCAMDNDAVDLVFEQVEEELAVLGKNEYEKNKQNYQQQQQQNRR